MRMHQRLDFVIRTGIWLLVPFSAARMISPLQAQGFMQDESVVKLRAETRVVEIDVSVRDSDGRPVEGLKQPDFTILDNGKARAFSIFSFNRNTPDKRSSNSPDPESERPQMLPIRPALPPNVFTNADAGSLPPAGHSTIILLDGVNGWFDNFVMARQGVLGLMATVPAN